MNNNVIVFASAFRADELQVVNAHNSVIASQQLAAITGHASQTCVGSWKEDGQEEAATELTFVTVVQAELIGQVAKLFLEDYKQDAILCVNPENYKAWLVNRDSSITPIGTFSCITEEEAKASECYTYWQGNYWLAK